MLLKASIAILFSFFISGFNLFAQTVDKNYLDGVLFVKVDQNAGFDLRDAIFNDPLFEEVRTMAGIDTVSRPFINLDDEGLQNTYRLEFSQLDKTYVLIDSLEALGSIVYAEQMPLYKIDFIPNDPAFNEQWSLEKIKARGAWEVTTGLPDIVIAIVDNGVRLQHEDLQENIWVNPNPNTVGTGGLYLNDNHGYDVADNNNDPNPPDNLEEGSHFNHGSLCAGIASAVSNNSTGIASIGFSASIMAVKCASDNSEGNGLSHTYEGIGYAIDAGADIISMSFGSQGTSITGHSVIQNAHNNNIVLVAAAGNNDTDAVYYPAAYEETIAVGATNANDEKAFFSNYGDYIDVMAPGTNIKSTTAEGTESYSSPSGTSMSAPLVSGLAALILANNPELNNEEVRQILKDSADPVNAGSLEGQLGAGRINAERALKLETFVDTDEKSTFKLFPNPANNYVTIHLHELQNSEVTRYKLMDVNGKTVKEGAIGNEGREEIDVSDLRNGLYIFNLLNSDASDYKLLMVH